LKEIRKHGAVHEMIPARNAKGVNAQGFVVLDQLQLPILKAFAQYNLLLHATLKFVVSGLCVAELPVSFSPVFTLLASSPRTAVDTPNLRRCASRGLWFVLNQRMAS
jgi:hypothetical protein